MHIKVHPKVCGKIQASNNRMSYDGVLWWANSDNSLELAFILLNAAFSMFMIVAHMMALCCCSSLCFFSLAPVGFISSLPQLASY